MEEINNLEPKCITFCSSSLPRYSVVESLAENLASEFCQRLYDNIRRFDEQLDDAQAVGMRLVAFGQAITFSVSRIGYTNPSLIHFYGQIENGQSVELIQHVSQISFLLTAVPRINPTKPKLPIGFVGPAGA
jgi:hypothetical protein